MTLRHRAMAPLFAAALAFLPGAADAQSPSARPVRLIVPFASGGGTDTVARILAQKMSERGRLMIVDNRPGGSGIVAAELVMKSPADVFAAYGEFLRKLGDPEIRGMLETVTDVREDHPEAFRLLKNDGHHFSWLLAKLLKDTYDVSHPIHNALVV